MNCEGIAPLLSCTSSVVEFSHFDPLNLYNLVSQLSLLLGSLLDTSVSYLSPFFLLIVVLGESKIFQGLFITLLTAD